MRTIFFSLLCFFTTPLLAQTRDTPCAATLVSATDGQPVQGALIRLLRSGQTTVSAADGSFILPCRTNDSIHITHLGFTPLTIGFGSNTTRPISIPLQPLVRVLEDVQVSTGYQSIPKERSTGSFEKISNSLFNQQVGANVLDRLETITNSLYVDKKSNPASPRFSIRGLATIQGPVAPLIILDNFPYEGDLNSINPNDVDNITVLKDAAAASIWGARAGNGVIVITTKRAAPGQPLQIEWNNNITLAPKPDLFYYNNISPSGFIDVEIYLYGKGYFNSQLASASKPALSPVVELLVKKANGSLSPAEADARINALRAVDLRNEYRQYMYRNSVNSQSALTLRTGTRSTSHLLSAGIDNNIGSLHEKYRRLTLRSENSILLGSRWQLTAGIDYLRSVSLAGRVGFNSLSASPGNMPIYTQLVSASGQALPVTMQYRMPYVDTVGGGRLLDWHYYAADDFNHIRGSNILQTILLKTGISYRFTKGLLAEIKYQYQGQQADNSTEYGIGSYLARNLVNYYSQLNYATGVVTYKVPRGGILSSGNAALAAHNIRAQLNFAGQWKQHGLHAIAGVEIRELSNLSESYRTYGYDPNTRGFTPVDWVNTYPNIVTGSLSNIPNEQNFAGTLNRYLSVFGNAAYTWRAKYTASISARSDASNLFGVRTNDKWSPLWSAGLAWDISKENFYAVPALPYLKLRVTYGYSGNADPSRSGFSVLSYAPASVYTLQPTAQLSQFSNPDLRWEKLGTLNIGFDFKAFRNRLTGSVEYYHKTGKDLLGFTPVDYTAVPAFRLIKNVASMKARGWDISISSINIQRALTWETAFNLSVNKDKVTGYLITNRSAINYLSGGLSISAIEGKPVYGLYVYPWAGLDPQTGDPMGYLNGMPSKDYNTLLGSAWPIDSLRYIGPSMPVVFGSMGNTLRYKGFSLTARLSWKMGYYFLRNSINYSNLFASRVGHGDYALRWQKPGDEQYTIVPSMVYPAVSRRDQFFNNSEALVEKADHIRLQYITLVYDVKRIVKSKTLSGLDIYVNINNIGILWRANKHGIDPDYRDNTILPPKTIAIGLKASF